MIIAVDFDGTIVEHRYPAIGKEIPFATATLRQLMQDGHKLILWTVREGELQQEAIDWCAEHGVRFYAVNGYLDEDNTEDHDAERKSNKHYSRKLKVDCFIDDRNVGGLPDWGAIYQMISRHISYEQYIEEQLGHVSRKEPRKKKHWWNL